MTLREAEEHKEYYVKNLNIDDEEVKYFLFTLGCFVGEPITVIAQRKGGCTVAIKDSRYNIDLNLQELIEITEFL